MTLPSLNNDNFDQALNAANLPVIVDFWAGWCTPCKMFSPILEQAAELLDGKATLVKVNIDENKTLAARFGILSVPTLVAFRNGEEISRSVGVVPKEQVAAMI